MQSNKIFFLKEILLFDFSNFIILYRKTTQIADNFAKIKFNDFDFMI